MKYIRDFLMINYLKYSLTLVNSQGLGQAVLLVRVFVVFCGGVFHRKMAARIPASIVL